MLRRSQWSRPGVWTRARATLSAAILGAGLTACQHGQSPATRPTPAPSARDSVQVGYGTEAKRDVTGSISQIDGDVTRQSNVTSLADMLEGRVPGLEVRRLGGGAVSLRIRGEHSFNAPGEPLLVLDGVPLQSNDILADLDPRDVKSIEVLKDAGSLAAFGSRGANGVILITTRKK